MCILVKVVVEIVVVVIITQYTCIKVTRMVIGLALN